MMEMVCADGGPMKLIVLDQDRVGVAAGRHTLDCTLCVPAPLPAPIASRIASQLQPLAHTLMKMPPDHAALALTPVARCHPSQPVGSLA
jgi:hypothetical protein